MKLLKQSAHLIILLGLTLVGFNFSAWLAAGATANRAPLDSAEPAGAYLPLVLKQANTPLPPTATATLTPTATATPPSGPAWLTYLNQFRLLAGLPLLTENLEWSNGDVNHSRYCVKNNYIGHTEDPGNPYYTTEGQAAAENGNVMVSSWEQTPDEAAIQAWMTGPFHALGIIDPALHQTGFGSYREADGGYQMAATLDVLRGLGSIPPEINFPVKYPTDNSIALLSSYDGGEWPDPLASCAGYTTPAGAPIILQIGSGSQTPTITAHTLLQNGTAVEHCIFDETSYTNPDGGAQSLGRSVLNMRDAIVIIPRSPLTASAAYTVTITTNGQTYTWGFSVSDTPQVAQFLIKQEIR